MNTYKSLDGEDYNIPGVGRTENGQITTDQIIENHNFELIGKADPQVAPAQDPQQKPALAPDNTGDIE